MRLENPVFHHISISFSQVHRGENIQIKQKLLRSITFVVIGYFE